MRGHAAFFQRVAELHAQESARRVTSHSCVVLAHEAVHHGRIGVEQFGFYREIVVVDDGVDRLTKWCKPVNDDPPDALDVTFAAHGKALKIDKEMIRSLVVGKAPSAPLRKCAGP